MRTLVTEIHVENVQTVGETDPYDPEGETESVATILMEGEWHGHQVKGLQVGAYLIWFQPSEFETLADFFGEN